MSEMGFENVFYLENFECAGDEVLVESSPPASPDMAARLAAPAQNNSGGESSPTTVRELIVIPELPNSIHLQHAIQQVSSTVVEVNGDSSGQSSPNAEAQHTFITVAMQGAWRQTPKETVKIEEYSDNESEGGNGVNYHVQYVTEPQEIYAQGHQNMESLRTYPVYGVATVSGEPAADAGWPAADPADYTAYPVVVAGDEAEAPASPATPAGAPRMPPATVQWLLNNYETAEGVSLPRSTLYSHYLRHCTSHRLEPVNAASFGKLIRSVFVGLRTRRLGTRGNSKYHYYGIRAKPDAGGGEAAPSPAGGGASPARPDDERRGAAFLYRQYLGAAVAPPDPPPFETDEPDDTETAATLVRAYRSHGGALLAAAAALDVSAVTAAGGWWRRAGQPGERLLAAPAGVRWMRAAAARLYQRALDLLLPDVLRPIPPQLTQAIRNFAKAVEGAVSAGAADAPPPTRRAQAAAAAALAAALRRYTSLNHLAQAARAVLTNGGQIHQMVSDLNRVDFRVVREQAAWACACGSGGAALRLERDFKATLGRGASLEQWAAWLERCVRRALRPHEAQPRFVARARRLLLDWSFYSSLVIRELTLRSAASFGSFHLIRLLYDEYVSYLIERRVAEHLDLPPIAVMHRLTEEDKGDEAEENSANSVEGEEEDRDPDQNQDQDDDRDGDGDPDGKQDHDRFPDGEQDHDQFPDGEQDNDQYADGEQDNDPFPEGEQDHDQFQDQAQDQDQFPDQDQDWDWDDEDDEDDEPDMKKQKLDSE